jgi:hypothetical protein
VTDAESETRDKRLIDGVGDQQRTVHVGNRTFDAAGE